MLRTCVILLTVGTLAMGQAMVQHAAAAAGGAAAAAGSAKIADGLAGILGAAAGAAQTAAAPAPPPPPPVPAAASRKTKPSPFAAQASAAGSPGVISPAPAGHAVPAPDEIETTASGEAAPGNMWAPKGGARPRANSNGAPSGIVPFSPFVSSGENAPAMRSSVHRIAPAAGNPPQVAGGNVPASGEPVAAMIAVPTLPPPPPPVLATPEKFAAIKEGVTAESVIASLGIPAAKIAMYEDGKMLETWRIEAQGAKLGTVVVTNGVVTGIEPVAR